MIKMYIYIYNIYSIFIIFNTYIYSKLNKDIKSKTPSHLFIILFHFMQKRFASSNESYLNTYNSAIMTLQLINISFPDGLDLQFAITIIYYSPHLCCERQKKVIWFHLQKLWIEYVFLYITILLSLRGLLWSGVCNYRCLYVCECVFMCKIRTVTCFDWCWCLPLQSISVVGETGRSEWWLMSVSPGYLSETEPPFLTPFSPQSSSPPALSLFMLLLALHTLHPYCHNTSWG